MQKDYSKIGWDEMKRDSEVVQKRVMSEGYLKVFTPGLGIGDGFQASSAVAAAAKFYGFRKENIIVNCWHPCLFENNPKCTVGTNTADPGNICLDTWPVYRQPNGGYGYRKDGLRLSTSDQYNIGLGMYGVDSQPPEFYPTSDEMVWGAIELGKVRPFITVQYQSDPPRKYYNVSPNLQRSESDDRWMTATDWYMDRWAEVVSRIKDAGFEVVQIGCEHEDMIEGCIDMRNVGIRKTFVVIGLSKLLIGHESFPQFAAEAMGIPSLVFITGRSCPDGQYLPGRTVINGAEGVECAPCWNREGHVDEWCPRTCMLNITPGMVLDRAAEILHIGKE